MRSPGIAPRVTPRRSLGCIDADQCTHRNAMLDFRGFGGDLAWGGLCIDVDQCQRCRVAVSCVYWSTSMGPGPCLVRGSAVGVGRDAGRRGGGGGGGGVGGGPPKGSASTLTNASANMYDDNVDSGQHRCRGPPRGAQRARLPTPGKIVRNRETPVSTSRFRANWRVPDPWRLV